jgi:hypothetical protein
VFLAATAVFDWARSPHVSNTVSEAMCRLWLQVAPFGALLVA